jgi:hypothetical protein
MRGYLQLMPMVFEEALLRVAAAKLDPTTNFKYFFVAGQSHTMLANPSGFISNGKPLMDWLKAQITDDPSWASTKP